MQGMRLKPIDGEEDFLLRISQTPGGYGSVNLKDWFCTTPNGLFGNISKHSVRPSTSGGCVRVGPNVANEAQPR